MLDVADYVMINQLLARYGHAIDLGDWDRFRDLFTENATIDYAGGTGVTKRAGRDAVVAWFRELADTHPPAHHVTNAVIEAVPDDDTRATVHSKFFAPYTRPGHIPKRLYGGDYYDIVLRTADGWRFCHKQCIPRWQLAVVPDDSAPPHRLTY